MAQGRHQKGSSTSDWTANPNRYLYWIAPEKFPEIKSQLRDAGFDLATTLLTSCQVLYATGDKVIYAPPSVWSRICVRQGSWYRDSRRNGQ